MISVSVISTLFNRKDILKNPMLPQCFLRKYYHVFLILPSLRHIKERIISKGGGGLIVQSRVIRYYWSPYIVTSQKTPL